MSISWNQYEIRELIEQGVEERHNLEKLAFIFLQFRLDRGVKLAAMLMGW